MVKMKNKFPEVGEFVMAKVNQVNPTYVYVDLEDYEGNTPDGHARGMLHIGEVASHWVRNIHDFIKEGARVVLKVLRTDEVKGHVDLSLRRVSVQQKKEKSKLWKRSIKAENILQIIAEHFGNKVGDLYEMWGFDLQTEYGDMMAPLEEIKEEGIEALKKWPKLPPDWHKFIFDTIDQNVDIPYVAISAQATVASLSPTGVEEVKEALLAGLNVKHDKGTKVAIHTIAAPRYKLDIIAKDYITAEGLYQKIQKAIETTMKKYKGEVTVQRL
ncbi:MAG: translation initiation factor IF-2 [Promethearchaeota archaeon CR_4]|nr:MAG: translation initiation factor IF-2 [Candidatus Lokiarchaeota archaeon CR_4]